MNLYSNQVVNNNENTARSINSVEEEKNNQVSPNEQPQPSHLELVFLIIKFR